MKRVKVGAWPWFVCALAWLVCWQLLEKKWLLPTWPLAIGASVFCFVLATLNRVVFSYSAEANAKGWEWALIGIVYVSTGYLSLLNHKVVLQSPPLYLLCGAAVLTFASFFQPSRSS